jgi:hypothetical protein
MELGVKAAAGVMAWSSLRRGIGPVDQIRAALRSQAPDRCIRLRRRLPNPAVALGGYG